MEIVYVLIKVESSLLDKIVETLENMEHVKEIAAVTGAYDIFVKLEADFISDVLSVVVKDIRKLEGVRSTETLISVKM